jgi:hypothetical protein
MRIDLGGSAFGRAVGRALLLLIGLVFVVLFGVAYVFVGVLLAVFVFFVGLVVVGLLGSRFFRPSRKSE